MQVEQMQKAARARVIKKRGPFTKNGGVAALQSNRQRAGEDALYNCW
jgi:hypothetical protein